MPNIYYNTQISDNMGETPEGFLLCKNVKIARTGLQEYTPREIGINDNDIKQYDLRLNSKGHLFLNRPSEEVFSPVAIASFEGKPVTDEHPDGELRPENCMEYAKGTVTNVRRGQGDDSEYLMADLLITDLGLINKIKTGKRDVSCGYRCRFRYDDHIVTQTEIVGNHVAVTYSGRAGGEVAIKDSVSSAEGAENHIKERDKKMSKRNTTNIFKRMFSSFIKDAEPEEVLEAADAVNKVNDDGEEIAEEKLKDAAPAMEMSAPESRESMPEEVQDAFQPGGKLDTIVEMLKGMDERLTALEKSAASSAQPQVKDSLDELRDEMTSPKKIQDEESAEDAVTVDPEQLSGDATESVQDAGDEMTMTEAPAEGAVVADADVVKFIDGIKPKIASLKNDEEKKMMSDALSELIRSSMVKKSRPAAVKDCGKSCDTAVVKDSKYFDIANRTVMDSNSNKISFGEACRRNHPSYKKQ